MADSYNELFGLGSHSEDANHEGWWLLQDNAASKTVLDQSSNGNNGTLFVSDDTEDVSTTGPGGHLPLAFDFDGSANYVRVGPVAAIYGATAFTVGVKVRIDALSAADSLISCWSSGTLKFNLLNHSSVDRIRAYVSEGSSFPYAEQSGDYSIDTWYNAVLRADGTTVDLWIDGAEEDSAAAAFTSTSGSQYLQIGTQNSGDQRLDGKACDGWFFSRKLTNAELSQQNGGPELNYVSGVSFSDAGAYDIGTWALPSPFASGSNGSQTQEVIAVNAAGDVLDSDTTATGTLDLSSESGNTCYLLARVSNTGGYDVGDHATRTSGYGSSGDGYYEIASVTAAGGGSTPITVGTLSVTARSESSISLSCTAASGGDDTLTYQLQRSDNDGSALSWSDIGSAGASLTFTDSTVVSGTAYLYRVEVSDGGQEETTDTVAGDAQDPLVIELPIYSGRPYITGLSSAPTPKIVVSRLSGGQPLFVKVTAAESTLPAGNYADWDYRWDFGDSGGSESMTDHFDGATVNPNTSQRGPEAEYLYRDAGTYTITLTVSARDEDGRLWSATTTDLYLQERVGIHVGDATGGTYTLTYDSNTTSAIAYDADSDAIATALHALAGLDSDNCYVRGRCVVFEKELSGVNETLSADFSSLTGGTASTAPTLRTDVTGGTATEITVDSISGWTEEFFDPDYAGENGASDGTESKPWATKSQLETFVKGGNQRHARLKRGTSMDFGSGRVQWEDGKEIRISPYGSGDQPILTGTGTFFWFLGSFGETSAPNKEMGDVVFSDIRFEQTEDGTAVFGSGGSNGQTHRPYSWCGPIVLDNVTYTTTGTGTARPVAITLNPRDGSAQCHAVGIWNCDFDHVAGEKSAVFVSIDRFFGMHGGSISGGDGDSVLDHHIYNDTKYHSSLRYIDGQEATTKSFFANQNCKTDAGYISRYHWIQGCDITGCTHGVDWSNSNNSQGASDGYFANVGMEGCRMHDVGLGVYGNNCSDITMRDMLIYNVIEGMDIEGTAQPTAYSLYRNRCFGGWLVRVRSGDTGWVYGNISHADTGDTCVFYDSGNVGNWEFDRNQYWAPDAGDEPFFDGSSDVTFATWQGLSQDANGSEADPGWFDPANGDFSQDGPGIITPKMGSANDAASLAAYLQQYGIPAPQLDITPQHPGVVIDTSGISQPGIMPNG